MTKEVQTLHVVPYKAGNWPIFRRAAIVAVIVGPIIALINHGDAIMSATLTSGDIFKILVTFLVPFCVSMVSSYLTKRETAGQSKSRGCEAVPLQELEGR